ncbi:MAG TPA: ACT domain-containing protein [Acidimicrobiales bacterium]|nr:ACT domain-containing protein [Acidimicrobiales bacterium]
MARVAVTAFGADRPGMVAGVTGVLMDHGGNLEDSAMTILGGHFAMMLLVEIPDDQPVEALEADLAAGVADLGLSVVVRPVADVGAGGDDENGTGSTEEPSTWSVSVHGADRPGIVHQVTALLAHHGANVVDLSTRVVASPMQAAYVLLLRITVGASADVEALVEELTALGATLGVEVHVRPDDADIL